MRPCGELCQQNDHFHPCPFLLHDQDITCWDSHMSWVLGLGLIRLGAKCTRGRRLAFSWNIRNAETWILTHWLSEAPHRVNARSPVLGSGTLMKTTLRACFSALHSFPEKEKRKRQPSKEKRSSPSLHCRQRNELIKTPRRDTKQDCARRWNLQMACSEGARLNSPYLNRLRWTTALHLDFTSSIWKIPEWEYSIWATFPKSNNIFQFIHRREHNENIKFT